MEALNYKLNIAKQKLSYEIDNRVFLSILFEMSRYFDKNFIEILREKRVILNQNCRNNLRKYFYYGLKKYLLKSTIDKFSTYSATNEDKINVLNSFIERCEKYDSGKIINSIKERYKILKENEHFDNSEKWLQYYDTKRSQNSLFSLFILDYSQDDFIKDEYNVDLIYNRIVSIYDDLENYRHFVFKLSGKLFDENYKDITWKIIYKIAIFCENFKNFNGSFMPFKRDKSLSYFKSFLKNKTNIKCDVDKIVNDFYLNISYGFKFEDCLISENMEDIILTFQKLEFDESPVPCPACMTTIQSSNSYSAIFLHSYECKNPSCPERSKSGRGKRFNEYGVYRYFKLVEDKPENQINKNIYSQWRKDIFKNNNSIYEMLILFYSYDNEVVSSNKEITIGDLKKRIFNKYTYDKKSEHNFHFKDLMIYKLFENIHKSLILNTGSQVLDKDIIILNGDSAERLQTIMPNQIGTAFTSPPYYNARQYSQWDNLLSYLVDMLINAKAVFNTLKSNGYYLYNIGDIVCADNVYVKSNMSKRRLMLGFYTAMIFEILGFNLCGNIIWYKGEVQSKRNSTLNHNSGYVKCINSYEHILVFKKGEEKRIISYVTKITPVIKINSKKENIAKHTAPYPMELVSIINDFLDDSAYLLDPFLGSGTTLKWCKKNGKKGIGFELDEGYYNLSCRNVNSFILEDFLC